MDRVVTGLRAQSKNPNRVNVYLDGEFAFGLSRIVAAWLSIGQKLSEEKIAAILRKEQQEAGLQKALLQLSYRPRTEAEIKKKLASAGFNEEVVESVLTRLRAGGLVEDESFARNWIENRSALKPRSQRYLAYELHVKGVAGEVVEKAMVAASSDEDLAVQAAAQYVRRLAGLDRIAFRKKLAGFLARRGFSYSVITSTVDELWEQQGQAEQQINLDIEEN